MPLTLSDLSAAISAGLCREFRFAIHSMSMGPDKPPRRLYSVIAVVSNYANVEACSYDGFDQALSELLSSINPHETKGAS